MILHENFKRINYLKIAAHACRLTMGAIFIFSGFVKAIDPWGSLIKLQEYLVIYGLEWFAPASKGLAIWMSCAELMMGCMLTFKVRIRMVSIFALTAMSIFTVVSLLSATVLPVDDCGCFGEAIRLTPWQTFYKNLLLWPMAFVIWFRYRPDKVFVFKRLEIALATIFFFSTIGIGYYSYNHLPIIDFRPYKIGVDLPAAIAEQASKVEEIKTTLIYRNIKSGKLREFALEDTQWHDESKWEWVETRTESEEPSTRASVSEFVLTDASGANRTGDVLATPGRLEMICITSFDDISDECMGKLFGTIKQSMERGDRVICLTPNKLSLNKLSVAGYDLESFNIDPSTMKTVIRAEEGVVSLMDGVIVDKRNWRDL